MVIAIVVPPCTCSFGQQLHEQAVMHFTAQTSSAGEVARSTSLMQTRTFFKPAWTMPNLELTTWQ